MIALIDDLPLVEFDNGRFCNFRCDWLRDELIQAAASAGYRDWWMAEHVAKSVTNYLINQFSANVLSASELRISVAEILDNIGYAEIGKHFTPRRPARDISLLELVRASGAHELTFFTLLREALAAELEDGVKRVIVTHLTPAVKEMLAVKLFTEDCACLRDEIIAFSRCFVGENGAANLMIRS